MLLHVVGLKFNPEIDETEAIRHFEEDVRLHERMPELVPSRQHWNYSKNQSGPLFSETDRGSELNNGSEWVVTVWLKVHAL